jgi:hypothetical protein
LQLQAAAGVFDTPKKPTSSTDTAAGKSTASEKDGAPKTGTKAPVQKGGKVTSKPSK